MYTRQTLVSPLHDTACHGCHRQEIHTIANVNKKIDNKGAGEQQIQKAGEWMN
jgi:H2-forming N5,N10-methylenetetrahydromethanopterin dehydrogenase-like enzyme